MGFNFRPKDSGGQKDSPVSIVIISASCCIPGMAVFDEQARRVVEQAISDSGVEARVKVMPATTAYFGGAPKRVMQELMAMSNQGKLGVPAVLINGRAVSYGVPQVEDLKVALLQAVEAKTIKEERSNE